MIMIIVFFVLFISMQIFPMDLCLLKDPLIHNRKIFSPKEQLHMRLVNKVFTEVFPVPTKLYAFYGTGKYLAKESILFDCVAQGKKEEAVWLFDYGVDSTLCFLYTCLYYNFQALNCLTIARHKNNTALEGLFLRECHNENEKYKQYIQNVDYVNINVDLCLASCRGNIQDFTIEYSKVDNKEINKKSIPLVIWAAVKNCDIEFLRHLQTYPEYKNYMLRHSDKFLRFSLLGICWSSCYSCPVLGQDVILSKKHFQRIKMLFQSNIFSFLTRNDDCRGTLNFRATDYLRYVIDEHKKHENYKDLQDLYDFCLPLYMQEIEKDSFYTRLLLTGITFGCIVALYTYLSD